MARKAKKNIEGVVERRRRNLGDFSEAKPLQQASVSSSRKQLGFDDKKITKEVIDEVDLDDIDDKQLDVKEKSHRLKDWRSKRKDKKQAKKEKWANRHVILRTMKRATTVAGLLVLLLVGFLGLKSWLALNNIIDRSGGDVAAIRDHIDKIGRLNILLVGVGGEGHDGGDLADSIIIASIDPFANDMVMLSVPRDLYVTIPNYGSDRINAAHAYGEMNDHPGGGVALLSETIEIT